MSMLQKKSFLKNLHSDAYYVEYHQILNRQNFKIKIYKKETNLFSGNDLLLDNNIAFRK